jgi:hypothetical protein
VLVSPSPLGALVLRSWSDGAAETAIGDISSTRPETELVCNRKVDLNSYDYILVVCVCDVHVPTYQRASYYRQIIGNGARNNSNAAMVHICGRITCTDFINFLLRILYYFVQLL